MAVINQLSFCTSRCRRVDGLQAVSSSLVGDIKIERDENQVFRQSLLTPSVQSFKIVPFRTFVCFQVENPWSVRGGVRVTHYNKALPISSA
jgi:hypothetical protein